MSGRHLVDPGVVESSLVAVDLNDPMLDPAGKRLEVLRGLHRLAEVIDGQKGRDRLARDLLAVDNEPSVEDLDLVAGQADQPLDVIGLAVARQLEHDNVAALRLGGEYATGYRLGGEIEKARQREMGVAIGVFGDEQVVADEQSGHQRARGNVERLEQNRA